MKIKVSMILILLFFLIAFAGEKNPSDLIWPPPPDLPRIKWVKALGSEKDLGESIFEKAKSWILGRKRVPHLQQPYGIAVDGKKRIYVSDSPRHEVFVFDFTKRKVRYIKGKGRLKLNWPIGVAVSKKGGFLYVSDIGLRKVIVFDTNRDFRFAIGREGEFERPAGLAVDDEREKLYVVDTHKHEVRVYDLDGNFISTIGKRGGTNGEFNYPTNIAVDAEGKIYVVDTGNFRVQIFDKNYKFIRGFGELGDGPGQFARPKGIGLDSEGHIYVVDAAFNNVQIFGQKGEILLYFGEYGPAPGQFVLPAGIFIDDKDRIYVADQFNRRVQVFQYISHKE